MMNIIVFTSKRHKKLVEEICKNDADISSGLLFNTKNIFTSFAEIEDFFSDKNNDTKSDEDEIGKEVFEKIEKSEELIFPTYYIELIEPITKEEISDFNQYLLNNYTKKEMTELISQLGTNQNMPYEIIYKYWIRAYTLQTDFYDTVKKKLQQKNGKLLVPYIKMMYEGIKNGTFKSVSDKELYRGAKISNKEIEKLKDMMIMVI